MTEIKKAWYTIGVDDKKNVVVIHRDGRVVGPFRDHAALAQHLIVSMFPCGEEFTRHWQQLRSAIDDLVQEAEDNRGV